MIGSRLMSPLVRTLRSLRSRGLVETLRSARRHLVRYGARRADRHFDRSHGTETHSVVENAELHDVTSPNLAHGIRYEPTIALPFARLLRVARIPAQGTFVDVGCGKGRVLMLAAQYGFKHVTGVEYSPALCVTARQNLDTIRATRGLQFVATIHAIDAVDYAFQPRDTVVFLFNPFDDTVLRRVLERLRTSLSTHPRPVWFIYHHPVWRSLVEESRLFEETTDYEFGGRLFSVFRTG